jgi:hypothetical protein
MSHFARHRHSHLAGAGLVVVLALAAIALGQWQVNTQVGRVNNRVGGELYGNNTNMGSIRYGSYTQTTVLPSEARYATWRSGALPSEIAMNARGVGPLAPNGAISYIPSQSSLQAAMKTPAPQLYNPAYNIGTRPLDTQLAAPQPGFAASAGSVRFASVPQPTSGQISGQISAPMLSSAQPLPSGQLPDGQLKGLNAPAAPSTASLIFSGSALNSGSIRYGSMSQGEK